MNTSSHGGGDTGIILKISAIAGVLAAILSLIITDWGFLMSVLVGVLVFLILAIVLWLLMSGDGASQGAAQAEATAAREAAERQAEADASAARDAAAQQAAAAEQAAADAAAAEQAAADQAAADAAAAERAAAEQAAADAAAAQAATDAAAAEAASAPVNEDFDGDGVLEGTEEGSRPKALEGARGGKADNLKEIKGVGPKMEKLLNSLGFYHFDQVASWSADEVAWVDANLQGFKGRVSRDEWVAQAQILATGGETEFSKRVDDGEVY